MAMMKLVCVTLAAATLFLNCGAFADTKKPDTAKEVAFKKETLLKSKNRVLDIATAFAHEEHGDIAYFTNGQPKNPAVSDGARNHLRASVKKAEKDLSQIVCDSGDQLPEFIAQAFADKIIEQNETIKESSKGSINASLIKSKVLNVTCSANRIQPLSVSSW